MSYTLNIVVKEFLKVVGKTETDYDRFYQIGLDVLRLFHLDTTGVPLIKELKINSNDTADFPCGFIKPSRICLAADNGQLYALAVNNNISLNKNYDNCGNRISPVAANNFSGFGILANCPADNFRNAECTGRFFGIGGQGGELGSYRIDWDSRLIVFENLLQTSSIVMEYIADINAVGSDFPVHPFCLDALKDGMFWNYKKWSGRPIPKTDYNASFRTMQIRFMGGTVQEWVDVFRTVNLRTPKF